MNLQQNLSARRTDIIVFTILGLFPLIGMGVDLIAPSLPKIAHALHASNNFSKNLITIFLFGIIVGNFSIGVLSDSFGRRGILLTALSVFVMVSLLPTVDPRPLTLAISRFFQGVALAFYLALARAVLSDILSHERMMKVVPLTATMWGIGPIIGPYIGGYLQFYFSWQACFYFYASYAFLGLLIFFLVLPETHILRLPLNIKQLANNYKEIFSHHAFLGMIAIMGLSYSLLIVFNSFGPFFIQNTLGFSSLAFGKIALICGVVFLCGTLLSKYLLKIYEPKDLIKKSLFPGLLLALGTVAATYFFGNNIVTILISTFTVFFLSGLLYPAAMAAAMLLFRHLAASAGATMSLVNISITCTSSLIISFFSAASAMPLVCAYVILLTFSLVIYKLALK
jgi:MFS transporter, DHA1 family, multidrug resistance protein